MISLCTVTLDCLEKYFEKIFLDSILRKTKLISEVLLAKVDAEKSFYKEWQVGSIKFIKFGCPNYQIHGIQHAIGLHECIDRAKNDYIFLSDPDLFFYNAADEIYFDLMKEHNLNIIGCSHHHSVEHSATFFPNQISLLVRKNDLPTPKFLENKLKIRGYKSEENQVNLKTNFPGKYLIPGAIPEYVDLFPNKNGLFETGCNLWIFNKERNWKWLAFQTLDCNTYSTLYHKCNLKIPRPQKQKLLYHCNHGTTIGLELDQIILHGSKPSGMMVEERYAKFKKEYELSKLEE
jgi:hypothetical protein